MALRKAKVEWMEQRLSTWRRMLSVLVQAIARGCPHPPDQVVADVLEGGAVSLAEHSAVQVQHCRCCGAVRVAVGGLNDPAPVYFEWRLPGVV